MDSQNDNTTEVINISSENVRLHLEGNNYVLRPRDTLRVHNSYALPRKFRQEGDVIPSVVDLLTGGRVLHIKDKRAIGAVS